MLETQQRRLTSNPLMQDESTKLEREQIYVPLALVQRTKPDKLDQGAYYPEAGMRLYEPQYEEKQRFEHEAFLTQILERGEGKTKGKRIALIGEPGAGKTTLLQCIAFWVLGETNPPRQQKTKDVAIWVSLADLQGRSLEEYLLQTWFKEALQAVRVTPEMEDALKKLFKSKRVWLLLDGIDELTSGNPQQKIASQLTGWVASARVVLTCRLNVWQANRNDLEAFETYRLLDFDYSKQVHQFIDNWFENLTSELTSEERRGKAERLKAKLKEAERERLRDLVQNPLRLTLLCSIWLSNEGDLPQTKAGLYHQFVEQIYKWKDNFFRKPEEKNDLNNALGRLALKDIQEGGSRFRLLESFIKKELGEPEKENSLFYKALQLGWLNHVGIAAESPSEEKVYAFLHTTFEEYFAALAIDDDWGFFLPRAHKNKPVKDETGNPKPYPIFEPQWKEVILLWLGREGVEKEQKEEFIKALVKFRDGCKGFYQHRAYFFAAAGIAEFRECSRSDKVVAKIVQWSCDYGLLLDGARAALQQTHRAKAIAALVKLIATLQQTHRAKAIDALVNLLIPSQNKYYTCMLALESLGEIAVGNESAKAALENFIANSQNEIRNRMQAAENLGKIDPGNEKAIGVFVYLITNSEDKDFRSPEDKYIRSTAVESLGKIAVGNEIAIDALIDLITTSQDESTRQQAVKSLGKIAVGDESAIDALLDLIANSQDESTRRQALESLGKIAVGDEIAIDALVNLIANSEDESIRSQAAESLGKIAVGDEIAIAALVNLIANSEDESDTRMPALLSLGEIAVGNKRAIAALDNLIANSENEFTRMLAAKSLGEIAVGNKRAIAALVNLIANSEDEVIRWLAASSLGQIDPGNERAIDALEKLIANSQHEIAHQKAAESLGQIAVGNERAIDALEKLIANSKNISTRLQAAKSLGHIAVDNKSAIDKSAIDALVNLIANSEIEFTRLQAASSLDKFSTVDPIIFSSIASILEKILSADRMPKVVIALRYHFKPGNDREEAIWHCAQNMPYSAFYEAWHHPFDIKTAINNIKTAINNTKTAINNTKIVIQSVPRWQLALVLFLWLSSSIFISNLVINFNVSPNVKNPTDIQRQQQIR